MDWQAVGVILSGIGLIGALLGFFFKNLIERRFEALETALKAQSDMSQKLTSEMSQFMRREECARCKEDSVYLQSTMDAKMDIILRRFRKMKLSRSHTNGKESE